MSEPNEHSLTFNKGPPKARTNIFQIKYTFNPDGDKFRHNNIEARLWMARVERHFALCPEASELDRLVYLTACMMGSAATKVVQAPTTNTVEFLVWFEEEFCKGSATNSGYSELRSLRQTGRLAKYQAEFEKLDIYNQRCDPQIPEEMMIIFFIEGLQNPALRRHLLVHDSANTNQGGKLCAVRRMASRLVEQNLFNEYAKNPKFAEVRDNANGRTNTILVGSCYQPGLSAEELPAFPRKEENRKRVHFSNQSQSKETHDTKAGIVADEEVHLQDNGNLPEIIHHRTDVPHGDMHTKHDRMGQSTERVKEGRVATTSQIQVYQEQQGERKRSNAREY
ncbi:hypothetical protein JCM33374_g3689 [Metschnikowia sp. JCM 33374]|nr:hypothetical protein JCM33374_g3689 [Metschnikowia sp. JCM 33374]